LRNHFTFHKISCQTTYILTQIIRQDKVVKEHDILH